MDRAAIEEKNAVIEDTILGCEDHGILTAYLHLDYGGAAQSFGGYALGDKYLKHFITRTLKTVGVSNWEDLKGKHIRVRAVHNKIHAIANFLSGEWFNPKEEFEKLDKGE